MKLNLKKSRKIPLAFWELQRNLVSPFSRKWFEEVSNLFGSNENTLIFLLKNFVRLIV